MQQNRLETARWPRNLVPFQKSGLSPKITQFSVAMEGATFKLPLEMKCDLCQEKATVFYTQVIDGKLKKSCLCEACAEAEGVTSPDGLLMPGEVFGEKELSPTPLDLMEVSNEKETECPNCGFTLESLKRVGRLGCSKCYEVFGDEIDQRLPTLHKGVSHTGYVPEGLVKLHELKSELEKLNARLDEAISGEQYEEAACLRDEINALKKEEEGLVNP